MKNVPTTLRGWLLELGVGQFNATMIIQIMNLAPATTDPKQSAVIQLVRKIQGHLFAMGAPIRNTGYLDEETAIYVEQLVGPGWMNRPWTDIVKAVVLARRNGVTLTPAGSSVGVPLEINQQPVSGIGGFLPEVPGGWVTWALAAAGLYYYAKHKR